MMVEAFLFLIASKIDLDARVELEKFFLFLIVNHYDKFGQRKHRIPLNTSQLNCCTKELDSE